MEGLSHLGVLSLDAGHISSSGVGTSILVDKSLGLELRQSWGKFRQHLALMVMLSLSRPRPVHLSNKDTHSALLLL